MAWHERLRGVPQLCEICFGPVTSRTFHVNYHWPGTHGLAVYIHTGGCYVTAVERLRRRNRRRTL